MNIEMFQIEDDVLVYIGEGPKDTKEAFAISFAKWEALLEYCRKQEEGTPLGDGGIETCGLCMLYEEDNCIDCPLANYTGQSFCRGTGYTRYIHTDSLDVACDAAKDELELLEQVRDYEYPEIVDGRDHYGSI
jgi:hypothetical protein